MSIYIKIIKYRKIFQDRFKIFLVSLLFGFSFKKAGVVRVFTVDYMGRADDKIKVISAYQFLMFRCKMRLQSKLNAGQHFYFIFVLLSQLLDSWEVDRSV